MVRHAMPACHRPPAIEDDPDLRNLTREMIESLGYNTQMAQDGTSALDAFANNPRIDLVLCDVVLPGAMDGPNIVEAIKTRRPDIRALLMSRYAETHLDSKMTGTADTLPLIAKPFDRRTLAQSLRKSLDA